MAILKKLECVKTCCNILKVVGRPVNKKKSLPKIIFIMFIFILYFILSMRGLYLYWGNVNYRFRAIEDFFVLSYEIAILLEVYISPRKAKSLFNIIERNIFYDSEPLSEIQNKIIYDTKRKENHTLVQLIFICYFFQMGKAFPQFLNGIYYMLVNNQNEIVQEDIPMPVQCAYPFKITNIIVYIVCASTQLITSIISPYVSIYWFSSSLSSLINIFKEIEIICCYIKEMDKRLMLNDSNKMLKYDYDVKLKNYLSKIIVHHQEIRR